MPSPSRKVGFFLSLLCWVLWSACSPPQESSIQDDITRYLEKKQDWSLTENRMNTAIETVRRDHFVHDDLTINVLRPLIGMSQSHIRELEVYQPQTLQVSDIHQQYIEGWRTQQFAIAAAVDAAERGDYVQLSSANNDLLQAQQAVMTTNANLQQLAEKAGLLTPGPAEQTQAAPPTSGEGLTE